MKLFFTNSDFIWKGMPRPAIPFLCNSDMEMVSAPNKYLLYVATVKGRTRAPKTWETYGTHLYEYFSFIEANDFAWDSVNETHLAAWRDAMLERGCIRSTVNQRLRCVHTFYKWAVNQALTQSIPFGLQEIGGVKSQGFLAHVNASGGRYAANNLTIQTYRPLPKFLHMSKAICFLDALTPHSLKLMGYLALLTGMRREEITALNYRVVPNPSGYSESKALPMVLNPALTPTKGGKERFVMVPYDLAVALWNYFLIDWPKRNSIYKRKYGKESQRFFLSAYGEELSIRYLNNQFLRATKKTGISCYPHMLRHTFGTYELLRMQENFGESKALLWVRDRLGHSSIITTEKYIHAADIVKHDEVDGYQLAILEALRGH